jgi:hypothetical protein
MPAYIFRYQLEYFVESSPDPLLQDRIAVELPEGYYWVFRGAVKPGDLYLNRVAFRDGRVEWLPARVAYRFEGSEETHPLYTTADPYTLLIRKGVQVDAPCERCEAAVRHRDWRFCQDCGELVKNRKI